MFENITVESVHAWWIDVCYLLNVLEVMFIYSVSVLVYIFHLNFLFSLVVAYAVSFLYI